MLKKSLYWLFVAPIHRQLTLVKKVGGNGSHIARGLLRGASRNKKRHVPIMPGMSQEDISSLDRWWVSMSDQDKSKHLQAHDEWLLANHIERERKNGDILWSLSGSRTKRQAGLRRQRGRYHLWLAILVGGAFISLLMFFTRELSLLYYLMFFTFLTVVLPEIFRHRVSLAQFIYGRRVSFSELLSQLPRHLLIDDEQESRYQRQLKMVMSEGVSSMSPLHQQFFFDMRGHQYA
jgi:hypothetical protein